MGIPRMTEPTDADLVRRILADRSADATAALYRRHWAGAWRAAFAISGRRALADDVAQDGFLKALRALARFDASRPFSPWLHRIVVNLTLNALRDERHEIELNDLPQHGDWFPEMGIDPDLMAALAALHVDRRTVVVLHHWFGYSTAELAELLAVPVGTVYSRLGRAMTELRTSLEVTNVKP